ncbi:MAG: serine hydrolase [Clostridia bacterium]|nr:serine hydrolase [Clostridia bacterium]
MELIRKTPGALGIEARGILDFINALEDKKLGVQSFMLIRHGQVASEAWWKPYAPEKVHQLYSLSKSFTSTAVGFAVQEGLLNLDDPVVSFFEDLLPAEPCENMKKMKVRNLLTMGTGHSKEPRVFSSDTWRYNFLTSYIDKEPGSIFTYNTPATYMLSAIVQKVTGQKVFDYLTPRLFEPLGIKDIWWEESPEGINTGGFGLNIRTEDIARFGLFLLHRGMVDGKQLLNPEWIDMATSRQISNGDPETGSDWSQGYGFQFWRCAPKDVYRGDGAFGQYCVVMPNQDAVLAVTSGSKDIGQILKEAWTHLLPAMKDDAQADNGLDALNDRIKTLEIPLVKGNKSHPGAKNAVYKISDNFLGLKKLSVRFQDGSVTLKGEFSENAMDYAMDSETPAGYGTWLEGGKALTHTSASYAYQEDGKMHMRVVCDHAPYIAEVKMQMFDDHMVLELSMNVSMGGQEKLLLIGIAEE